MYDIYIYIYKIYMWLYGIEARVLTDGCKDMKQLPARTLCSGARVLTVRCHVVVVAVVVVAAAVFLHLGPRRRAGG